MILSRAVDLAVYEARKSAMRYRHGCVALNFRGKVVCKNRNNWGPYAPPIKPGEVVPDKYIEGCAVHAEVNTYMKVPKRFRNNLTLVVVRVSNGKFTNNRLRDSKPCAKCGEFIAQKKIRVYYSTDDGDICKY